MLFLAFLCSSSILFSLSFSAQTCAPHPHLDSVPGLCHSRPPQTLSLLSRHNSTSSSSHFVYWIEEEQRARSLDPGPRRSSSTPPLEGPRGDPVSLRPLRPLEDDLDAKNPEERALRSVRPSVPQPPPQGAGDVAGAKEVWRLCMMRCSAPIKLCSRL